MRIGILGSGSWGTALSSLLHKAGHDLSLWAFDQKEFKILSEKRENPLLPGIVLSSKVLITDDIKKALAGREGIVVAVPSHAIRSTAGLAASAWPPSTWAVCVSKGLEMDSRLRLSQVLQQTLPPGTPIGVLSGPSHAEEVSVEMPTTVVAASEDSNMAEKIQKVFHTEYFRVYTSQDVLGVELGGSLKNIIAIAAGILDGMGLGDNTKAALMTRGLYEITKMGVAMGAKPETFSGLAGMGDLVVTCISHHSRNRLLGEKIGKGIPPAQAMKEMTMVAEGVKTSKAALAMARDLGVEVPITQEVYQVLFENKPVREAISSLLSRSAKPENMI